MIDNVVKVLIMGFALWCAGIPFIVALGVGYAAGWIVVNSWVGVLCMFFIEIFLTALIAVVTS